MKPRFAIAAILAICAACGGIAWTYFAPWVDREPFSRAAWLEKGTLASEEMDPGCVRGGMALDLIVTGRLVGLNPAEVAALLGAPRQAGMQWQYALGQCTGFGWEQSELVVLFERGRSVSARMD